MSERNLALERVPPQALDAESAVIGSVLVDGSTALFEEIAAIIEPRDFYRDANRTIFETLKSINRRGDQPDLLQLADALERAGELDKVGGRAYLVATIDHVAAVSRAPRYAKMIKHAAIYRRLIEFGGFVMGLGYDQPADLPATLDQMEKALHGLRPDQHGDALRPFGDILQSVWDKAVLANGSTGVVGIPTGFQRLDAMTQGLCTSTFTIVAGRPSMGKSAFVTDLALTAAEVQRKVAIFSLEMDGDSVGVRVLADETRIDGARIRSGNVRTDHHGQDEWELMARAIGRVGTLPIWLDDTPALAVTEIRSRTRRLHATEGVDLVVIDYLQLVKGGHGEGRTRELDDISESLKELSRELKIAVVACAQIKRVESREDKRPLLSDLRESGGIEAAADVVLMLYRPWYYSPPPSIDEEEREPAEVLVRKNRNGPTDTVRLNFHRRFASFEEPALASGDPGEVDPGQNWAED